MNTKKIGYNVIGREVADDGLVKLTVSFVSSTKDREHTRELPYILNALAKSHLNSSRTNIGFDYTFNRHDGEDSGFLLAEGYGFPYFFAADGFPMIDKPSLT